MFRKPKRNFRKKVADSDSDHEKEEDTNDAAAENVSVKPPVPTVVPEKKTKSKKKSEDKAAKATILSFEDEDGEETEVFKVKKSSHSKRIAKQLKKESQKEKEIKTDSPLTIEGDNSADQLKELRHKQCSNPMGNGKVINIPDEDGESDESEEESGAHAFRAILQRGEIPDANTIHMIRKKRQMAREMGDFIPVEDVNENSGSRLIRDDENDRSDDEEDGRIDFSVNNFAKERQKMKDEFLAAEHGSDEESDQERQWEEQQIRKGVSTQQVGGPPDSYTSSGLGMPPSDFYNSEYTSSLAPATAYAPAQSAFPAPTPVTGGQNQEITIDIITKRLRERVESMTGIHRSHLQEKEQLVQDVEDTERSIDGAEDRSNALEERYRFFQEMRGYVRDLVECLNEKVPQINELERQMVELLRERSGRLVARRQQDVQDQCQDYMANKSATVLKQTDADAARQRRTAEREARKSRRRRAREGKNIRGHHDGLSSDDEESKSDFSKFKHTKERVLSQHQLVFEDVVDDFCQIDAIRDRFDQWRRKQGDSYKEAYISLCLPKLFTPLLRLQLVLWNPLEENCPDFEESPWFSDLLFYGFEEDVILHRVDDDDDIKLLPSIVDKVLAPKITALVESVWDPMSTSQTSRLVNLLQRLTSDYPPINAQAKNTQTLLKAIVTRIRKTLDDDVFMPLYPKSVIENKSSGPAVFFQRQFWACIKLLGNILSWHGILAPPILQHMALDSLLNRYIILGLQNSGLNTSTLDKLQAIVSTFPRDWFSDLEGEKTLPQLENICRYLNYAANTLYQTSLNKRELDQKEAREMIKQISKMLVNIRAIDHAKNMAEKYSFKLT